MRYGGIVGSNRAEVVRCGTIVDRLKAINSLQQRTGNKKLFESQREKLMKELSEVRKGL
ncbi:MAG: hypothetical protein LLF98_12590 [Clostridium sp.]|uniref:hypothetical protein n=1 Tax=Clostridium sp. TaxID=1506 RepID=UPI0025C12C30|nr:hypothetical protein [Clostridium sp.]MCE5222056.1 hypothetical protein [Clostridium sp.]